MLARNSTRLSVLVVLVWLDVGCEESRTGDQPGNGLPPVAAAGSGPPNTLGAAGSAAMPPTAPAAQQPMAAGSQAVPGPAQAAAGAAAPAAPPPVTVEPEIIRPAGWQDASHGRGATPDYPRLFAEDRVQRIDLAMTAESKQMLDADLEMLLGGDEAEGGFFPGLGGAGMEPRNPVDLIGGEPIYVPVTLRYDGGVWTRVGMRFKGNSSLASAYRSGVMKLGFRLDFDRYEQETPETLDQRFYGFGKMTFSSNYQDPSMVRDKLASEILTSLGSVAARCAFYQVYVDTGSGPVYWGLYTMIEDPADQLIEAQFEDESGNLYKPDGPGAEWLSFDMQGFEKKSNEEAADYSDVMAAIAALHAPRTDAQAWRTGLEAVFNVKSFLDVLAFSRAIGHWDGYGVMAHNYYLYGDPTDAGRLLWISWDHNLSLQPSFFGGMSVMMDETTEDWPLIRYLLDDQVYRAQYVEALRASLGAGYEKATFDARAKELHTLVAPYVVGTDGQMAEQAPYTFITDPEQFHTALTNMDNGMIVAADTLREAVRTAIE